MTTLHCEDLMRALPYARRYARALTGSQPSGDGLVAQCLKEMIDRPGHPNCPPRRTLYKLVTRLYDAAITTQHADGALSQKQRQLLLLTSLEELAIDDAAEVVALDPATASAQLSDARARLCSAAVTDVLIIEDEPIIAMDIEELVQGCGHRVVGVATSEAEAVAMAALHRPGLILADINLGSGGDGSSAVSRIMKHHYAPVIFVTAYPERLLTGAALEPVFVITKPFDPLTLGVATYQAVTGGPHLD